MAISRSSSLLPEIDDNTGGNGGAGNDVGFHSIRDRFPFKRNPAHFRDRPRASHDRQLPRTSRSHLNTRFNRKGLLWLFPFKGKPGFYAMIIFVLFLFALASMVLQSSIMSVLRQASDRGRPPRPNMKFGTTLKFVPGRLSRSFMLEDGLDRVRLQPRIGVRAPRLALILSHMKKDPQSLMLFTIIQNLQKLGYVFKIFAVGNGNAQSIWEKIDGHLSFLSPEDQGQTNWSIFEGVIVDSLESKKAMSRPPTFFKRNYDLNLMAGIPVLLRLPACWSIGVYNSQHTHSGNLIRGNGLAWWMFYMLDKAPFCSVPVIWIIQEDNLSSRLNLYEKMGWEHLVSHWRSAFGRARVVVFPDFTFPMLYSVLDTGNFFVIPGSPVDVWAGESYSKTHSKDQLRDHSGFHRDDILVVIIGSSIFYDGLSWDYAVAMHAVGPLLLKYARRKDSTESYKFIFLCGNSTDGYGDALQEVASSLGLPDDSLRHYGLNGDVNSMLLMADIVLYGSAQDIQGFPPLLIRAMTFGVPVIAPDFPVLRKYIVDGVHGIFFSKHSPDSLMSAFSLLLSNGRLSKFAQAIASSGRQLAKNVLALECTSGYARLLENVLSFPSDTLLPKPVSQLQQGVWEWDLFENEIDLGAHMQGADDGSAGKVSIVYALEQDLARINNATNVPELETEVPYHDIPTKLDWDILQEIERSEEVEMLEMEELEERMERHGGIWDVIYRNARKSEKLKFEANERDEGELERMGQPVCIYEIYSGSGAWPFLHHGSLYRGLSLSRRALRQWSDDVDAISRLPILNDTYFRDILCEIGAMFAIANRVDSIHRRPWIGFQSWRAAGSKVALSPEAERVLTEALVDDSNGDVIYFWSRLDTGRDVIGSSNALTFWSMCDILNGGNCRTAFQDGFRQMYALPPHAEALPPMPEDGHYWSALHSWVMPTPSFLEFMMFSRMFVDSIDALHTNSTNSNMCLLGSSEIERKHCYCRVLELLINIWAYHSARKMVYIDPNTGAVAEQHPVELRRPFMWAKYFNFTTLKSMDEDLAEAADDGDHPRDMWLWPLTGEVHWQGVYEREREERYRLKMDKKRKLKEKLTERMKYGYKQKSLGR